MPLSIDDVITPTTADEVEAEVLSLCVTADLQTSAWQAGSWVRTIIEILSQEIATKSLVEVEVAKGGLGDLASASWAKLWAKSIYDIDFVAAAPSTGVITLTNASVVQYDLDPGDLIVAHSVTGKTYRNQATISVLASSTLANVAISADEVGTSSDAAPGQITVMVSSLVGVTVTNPAAVLGADEETTKQLVTRSRAKLASLSPNGPKDAYNFVATSPTLSATSSPITRSRTSGNQVTGVVSVYIATATGTPTAPNIAIVQAAIDFWAEPWCVQATAIGATEVVINITYTVWIRSSLTALQIEDAIETALSVYVSTVPVGGVVVPPDTGNVYVEALTHVIHTTYSTIERVLVTLPAADIVLTANQVPVIGTVTATINIIV